MTEIPSWLWMACALGALLLLDRWLHRHLQGLVLLVVRSQEAALLIYSLIFVPGVLLHEASHWLTATLLLVRTGRFSVWPARQPDGTLRLGYVETERVDFLREGLIGAAPLVFGGLVVGLVALFKLRLGPVGVALGRGNVVATLDALRLSLRSPDAWIWLYLAFAVSNSMLPSASDRRAWLPVTLLLAALGGVVYLAGFGPASLAGSLDRAARAAAAVFSITIGLDLAVMPGVWLLERAVSRRTGLRVEY